MKKVLIFSSWFCAVFVILYLSLCFLVPPLRIKLAAPPMVYFKESIQSMVGLKALIAGGAGLMTGCLAVSRKN